MSDNIVSLAERTDVLQVADMLERVAAELRASPGPVAPKAALVIAWQQGEMADTTVHFAGGVTSILEGLGLFEIGKAQTLRPD